MDNNKLLSWCLVLVCMLTIFYLSNMNSSESNSKSKSTITKAIELVLDITNKDLSDSDKSLLVNKLNKPLRKCAHFTIYFILSVIVLYTLIITNTNEHKYLLPLFLLTLSICFIYSCTDEYHQTLVKGRTGQLDDILIDSTGFVAGSGTLSVTYISYRQKRRKKSK